MTKQSVKVCKGIIALTVMSMFLTACGLFKMIPIK